VAHSEQKNGSLGNSHAGRYKDAGRHRRSRRDEKKKKRKHNRITYFEDLRTQRFVEAKNNIGKPEQVDIKVQDKKRIRFHLML